MAHTCAAVRCTIILGIVCTAVRLQVHMACHITRMAHQALTLCMGILAMFGQGWLRCRILHGTFSALLQVIPRLPMRPQEPRSHAPTVRVVAMAAVIVGGAPRGEARAGVAAMVVAAGIPHSAEARRTANAAGTAAPFGKRQMRLLSRASLPASARWLRTWKGA
mmetsp:Transcript_66159/g.184237  ORF Transcript_66159/g.184237 Transcript_66159/m.184237 type:complete len:164 (-) Transcript_66159:159-650(-)